jgi:hypothetical protein
VGVTTGGKQHHRDLMLENRKFPPSAEFKRQALVVDTSLYDEANEDYEAFWAQAADL